MSDRIEPVDVKFGDMPSYGSATGNDMLRAVHEAIYGTGDVSFSEIDDLRPLGHQMVPRINFNSLNRIVTAFANGSATHPASKRGENDWQIIDIAPIHQSIILCFWWSHAPDQAFRCEGYLDRDERTWRLQNGEKIGSHVTGPTHWMHFPDAPKPEGK